MKLTTVAVMTVAAAMWTACADDGVRHTPDAAPTSDGPVDASPDAALHPAMLSGSPGATDFGDVVIGQTTSKVTYTIANDGDEASGTLSVLADPQTAGFAISDNTCSGVALAMHETCTFAVAFTPPMAGTAMATIHIAATPGGEITRDLTGNGLQPGALDITEASHDFTRLAVDATPTTHTFTVKNTGQVPTGIPMPSITGTANTYSVMSTTCTAALAANATCNVIVKFDPATVGSKPATLVVTGSPGGSDSATLSGTGIAHVSITKAGNGTGMVTSNMAGINCGSACGADFSATPVTLTAVPDTGMTFGGFTGACSMSPCTLDLTGAKTVNALFTKQHFTLTTSTTGNGLGTVVLNPAPVGGAYDYGQVVTVTASADISSTFTQFGGDCSNNTCTVTMTANHTVSAEFTKRTFTLTTSTTGDGSGTITGAGTYYYGDPVTVTATPDISSNFTTFGGDCANKTCTLTMTANHAVSANFDKKTFTLTTSVTGNGTITGAGTYKYGDPVTVTATPATGWNFKDFGGDCSGNTCSLTMFANHAVVANFTVKQFTLTTSTNGTGSGTITGGGTYDYDALVTLTETPGANSTFKQWGGDCSGTTGCSVRMTADHAVSATFDGIPETLSVTASSGGKLVTSPAGISCTAGTCTHDFPYGQPVTISAVLNTGFVVGSVGGACSALPCTVTMDQARQVSAEFVPQTFKLSLTIGGDATGTVTVGGVAYNASASFPVTYGQQVTLTETHLSDWFWAGWGGACSSSGTATSCTIGITGDTSVTATFMHVGYSAALTATTLTANGLPFEVTYPNALGTAECLSTGAGTACSPWAGTLQTVNLVAHSPPSTSHVQTWLHAPTWTGCDSVSVDHLTCTYKVTGPGRVITVSGDMQ